VIFLPQWANAQDLPPLNLPEQNLQKMDSTLAQLYQIYQEDGDINSFIQKHRIYEENGNVRVILEVLDNDLTIKDIFVEKSIDSLVQALVPIEKLEEISMNENVRFLRIPIPISIYEPDAPIDDNTEISVVDSELEKNFWYLLLVFPAIAVIVSIVVFVKRRK